MNLFYLRHHYQSVVRSTSFDGEVLAFIIIAILFGSSIALTYDQLEFYAGSTSEFFFQREINYHLFLMLYLFLDLLIRLVYRRPLPKLKYYVLWNSASKQIASQYLFTSLFGIMPFVLAITMFIVAFKANEWLGTTAMITVGAWWLSNHFVGLISQFANSKIKTFIVIALFLTVLIQWLLPSLHIGHSLINPLIACVMLAISALLAYHMVKSSIEKREVHEEQGKSGLLESLPVLSFKNPVFQLEWALLVRNKRTRSNLLLGLISVLFLPFLVDGKTEWMMTTLIFFITTGFFIIQHGVYSLGWEGSYFDFLITNISPSNFIKTRYLFYAGTCVVGLLFASIPTMINGLSWTSLFVLFLYNVGVTIPLVLYRSTLNRTKIVLTENSFMNYSGMMTGPIFVSSFLVTLLPLFIYGIGQAVIGENAIYLLGLMGIVGLMLFNPITDLIAKKYHSKKYHLSQSFKS
ncbi:DUF5687 family protein [Ekhidna sp.]|uniref:DUF5687 family protein n=1 Tax=Ekhidna sp. TaxID=2608089 RepID=UPI0032978723